jgi:hypothetical protein
MINKNKMEWDDTLNGELNEEDEEDEYDKYYRPHTVLYDNHWYFEYKNNKYIVRWVLFDRNGKSFGVSID